jgi:hypothetical protein
LLSVFSDKWLGVNSCLGRGERFSRTSRLLVTDPGGAHRGPDVVSVIWPILVEQSATAALRLRFRHGDPLAPYVSAWSDRIIDLEDEQDGALEHFSDVIFARLKEWLATPPPAKIQYLNRMTDLHGKEASVSIISLNYDLLVETALINARRPFVNGFREGRWSPEVFTGNSDIRLYKLHGSLAIGCKTRCTASAH